MPEEKSQEGYISRMREITPIGQISNKFGALVCLDDAITPDKRRR